MVKGAVKTTISMLLSLGIALGSTISSVSAEPNNDFVINVGDAPTETADAADIQNNLPSVTQEISGRSTSADVQSTADSSAESNTISIYKAANAAEMAAAVSTLYDGSDNRIVVSTDQDLSDIEGNGHAVYYDGAYVISFNDASEKDTAVEQIKNTISGDSVSSDTEMSICETNSGTSEDSSRAVGTAFEEPSQEVLAQAEAGLTLREKADQQGKKLVAVIDTGINELAEESVNLTSDSNADVNGHGTRMAQYILGASENKAMLLSIKAIGDNGRGTTSNVYAAIKYAMDAGADIISMSISAKDSSDTTALKDLIKKAIQSGITIVASAGNNSEDASGYVPADIEGVITAGSCDTDGTIQKFSNYGNSVDYLVVSDSTSEAAAKLSGLMTSGNEKSNADVFECFDNDVQSTSASEHDQSGWSINTDYTLITGANFNIAIKNLCLGSTTSSIYTWCGIYYVEFYPNGTSPAGVTLSSLTSANVGIVSGTITAYWDSTKHAIYVCSSGAIKCNADSSDMFAFITALSGIVNLNCLDTSSVTDMHDMFISCQALQSIDVSNFNTSSVTNMYLMFGGCSKLLNLDLSNFNTSAVTRMDGMFNDDIALGSLDVHNFVINSECVTTDMFKGCTNLYYLNISSDLSSYPATRTVRYGDSVLETQYATSAAALTACQALTYATNCSTYAHNYYGDTKYGYIYTTNNAINLLSGNTGLVKVNCPLNNSTNVALPLTMYQMYSDGTYGTTGYTSLPQSQTSSVTLVSKNVIAFDSQGGTFTNSRTFTTGTSIKLPATVKAGYIFTGWWTASTGGTFVGYEGASYTPDSDYSTVLYGQWISASGVATLITGGNFNVAVKKLVSGAATVYSFTVDSTVKSISFYPGGATPSGVTLSSLTSVSVGLSSGMPATAYWDPANSSIYVCSQYAIYTNQTLNGIFYAFSALEAVNFNGIITGESTNFGLMFYNDTALKSLDLSGFDTSSATDMSNMFNGCSGLTTLSIENFNTFNVSSMLSMFKGCSNLTSIALSGFDTSKVMDMSAMFQGCSKLTSIDVSTFNTSSVSTVEGMFQGCSSLKSIDVSNFKFTVSTLTYDSMFKDCTHLKMLDFNINISAVSATKTKSNLSLGYTTAAAAVSACNAAGYSGCTSFALYSYYYYKYQIPNGNGLLSGDTELKRIECPTNLSAAITIPVTMYQLNSGGTIGTTAYTVLPSAQSTSMTIVSPFLISFDSQGGTTAAAHTAAYHEPFNLPSSSKSGSSLTGWFTAASGGTSAGSAGDSYIPEDTATLYAQWGAEDSIPPVIEAVTYQRSADGFELYIKASDTGSGMQKLVISTWSSSSLSPHQTLAAALITTITTEKNNVIDGQTYNYHATINRSDFGNSYSGYNATLTAYDNAGNTDDGSWNVAGDRKILDDAATEFTIVLNQEGGSGGTDSVLVEYGGTMPSITVPVKNGYVFGGYFGGENGVGTQYYTPAGISAANSDFSANGTIYAKWIQLVTLTLNSQITGNYGDRTKNFDYTVTFSNVSEASVTMTTSNVINGSGDTSIPVTGGSTSSITVHLHDDDTATFTGLNSDAKVTVSAANENYISKYQIDAGDEQTGTLITENVIGNSDKTIVYTMTLAGTIPTGIEDDSDSFIIMMTVGGIAALIMMVLWARKRQEGGDLHE